MTLDRVTTFTNSYNFFKRYKSVIILFIKIFIAIGLLAFIISEVKIQEIILAIKQSDLFFVLSAFLLSFFNIYLQYYKWKLTAGILLQESQRSKIWLSLFYGFSAGIFTPARIGEYFGRAIVFKDKSILQVTLATLLDKFFLLFIVLIFGSISSILFINYYYHVTYLITTGLLIILFSLFFFTILMIFSERFWNNIFFLKLKNSNRFQRIFEKLKFFENLDKRYATKMFLVSILFYACILVQYALLVIAFSDRIKIVDYLWAGNLLMFAKTIIPPVSLGELGIREGASVFFITQIGESATTGFNASIFLFIINILLPAIIGFFLLIKKNND